MANDDIDPRMASASTDEDSIKRDAALLTAAIEDRNISFLRDLEAANALKSFLVGSGVEVPAGVLTGLADLTESYISPISHAVASPLKDSESAEYLAPPWPPSPPESNPT